jgi:hypothetical protein
MFLNPGNVGVWLRSRKFGERCTRDVAWVATSYASIGTTRGFS